MSLGSIIKRLDAAYESAASARGHGSISSYGIPILLAVLSILVIIAAFVFWNYYSDIQPPIINDGGLSFSKIGGWKMVGEWPIPTEISLTATKIVENPNSFPITITKAEYEIYINDNFIEEGQIPHTYELPPNGKRNIQVQVNLDLGSVINLIKSGLDIMEGNMTLKLYTDIYANAPLKKTVIAQKWNEKEIQLPKMEITKPTDLDKTLYAITDISGKIIIKPLFKNVSLNLELKKQDV